MKREDAKDQRFQDRFGGLFAGFILGIVVMGLAPIESQAEKANTELLKENRNLRKDLEDFDKFEKLLETQEGRIKAIDYILTFDARFPKNQ